MVEAKQVKVDNWGIFFLQRLQQFYNKAFFCDLTLQFEDNVQIKVHRLVMNACTEYFQMLENTCVIEKDVIMMPSNLPSDVVIPIINFMYSGILEFNDTLFDRLYSTAKLMNMSVLTKLLDAQKNPIQPIKPVTKKVQSVTPITWNLQGKKIMTKNVVDELPETLPGRKLPIWKRKSAPITHPYIPTGLGFEALNSKPFIKSNIDEAPKPTRFEWPDEDSTFENSFDEISYTSKPIILPAIPKESVSKPSTSSTFDEIKRSGPMKRSASPVGNQCKKVNIQDVKEYLKEHKIRSDYIDYDDSETTDNDLQTYDNADDHDSNEEGSKDGADIFTNQVEDTPSKGILKTEKTESSPNKHVRFSLDGKENVTSKPTVKVQTATSSSTPDHTKIITEVLKKYPHLVKKNKNIRLKILAKGTSPATTPVKITTTTSASSSSSSNKKIQYMVMKSDSKSPQPSSSDKKEEGPWVCKKCDQLVEFTTYHTYRQHLTDVHNEKTDSQMCNTCGQIFRKQNMLIYHKYTKHNIQPPAMYNFPKCKECSYIAISPTMLNKHVQQHRSTTENKLLPQWSCQLCDKAFFSENILLAHQKRSHNLEEDKKEDTKEKIKILSDIKVNTDLPPGTTLIPVRQIGDIRKENVPEPLEPSSEAEALSNVASGIAASLGLVDTIVVLDENQFILQSAQGVQQNVINNTGQDYILPDMQMPDLTSIATTSIDPNQNPVVTLSSDTNTVLTQSLNKSEISTTDELVMVLTDHDYSDAANQAVISGDNNIVVLYSHPVQTQAAMMINSETGMLEVDKNYQEAAEIPEHQEESIEMIQQEINNHLETDIQQQQEYRDNPIEQDNTYRVCSESVARILQDNQHLQHEQLQQAIIVTDQPMEESIQMIQDEINNIPQNNEKYQPMEIDNQQIIQNAEGFNQEYEGKQEYILQMNDQNMEDNVQNEQQNIESVQEYVVENGNQEIQTDIQKPEDNLSQDVEMEEVKNTPEENIVAESSKMLDSTEELLENTQKMLQTVGEIPENQMIVDNLKTDVNHEVTEGIQAVSDDIHVVSESIQEVPEDTHEISESIQEVPEGIHGVSDDTHGVSDDTHGISENIQEVSESIQGVAEEMNDSSEVLHGVPEDVNEVSEVLQGVSDDIHGISDLHQEETKVVHELPEVKHEVSEGIQEVTEVIHEIPEGDDDDTQKDSDIQDGTEDEMSEPLQFSEPENDVADQLNDDSSNLPEVSNNIPEVSQSLNDGSQEVSESIDQISEYIQEVSNPVVETSESKQVTESSQPSEFIPEPETVHETSETTQEPPDSVPQETEISEPIPEASESEALESEVIKSDESQEVSKESPDSQNLINPESNLDSPQNNINPNPSEKPPETPEHEDDEEENIVEAIKSEVKKEIIKKAEKKKLTAISSVQAKEKISKILDDWDDADTDSPQSKANNGSSINKLIDDWEDEEDT